jgi:hypothetical protein
VTAAVLIAAVAAVLTPGGVVFVDTAQGAVLRVAELPGEGLAPRRARRACRAPLRQEDLRRSSALGAWDLARARFPPFADYDRTYAVLGFSRPALLQDRLLLERVPLEVYPGLGAALMMATRRLSAMPGGGAVTVARLNSSSSQALGEAARGGGPKR